MSPNADSAAVADDATRVLVVEDDPAHLEAIRRALAAAATPFAIRTADSLHAYRASVAREKPQIALLDLILPDGRAVGALTAPAQGGEFPILIMTSFGNEQTAVEALKAGALDYIVKSPESFAQMPRTLERALREWRLLLEQARAAAEIRRLNEELERRVVERTAQYEAANRELEAFTYSVSHDLRAPLRAIDGFTGILSQEYAAAFDDEGRRLLGVVRSNVKQMDELMTNLLDLSRVARGEMRSTVIDMTALAAAVWRETATAGEREFIAFSLGALPAAYGDQVLIRQVFANLFANAIKYSRPQAERRVTVEGRIESDRAIYTVRDTGVGFEPEYAHKLFGVFQRLHRAEDFEGTGVGLAIVQRIVHRHGGQVSAAGRPGEGAAFSFSLPRGDLS